jgi:hypothetical protein
VCPFHRLEFVVFVYISSNPVRSGIVIRLHYVKFETLEELHIPLSISVEIGWKPSLTRTKE